MQENSEIQLLVTSNPDATIMLDCTKLTGGEVEAILNRKNRREREHVSQEARVLAAFSARPPSDAKPFDPTKLREERSLVKERMLQELFEAHDYNLVALQIPVNLLFAKLPESKERAGKTYAFIASSNLKTFEDELLSIENGLSTSGLLGLEGYVKIGIDTIYASADHFWKQLKPGGSTIKIKEFSDPKKGFWRRAGRNWNAVVHNFLQGVPQRTKRDRRVPILEPKIHRPKPSSEGCGLSIADTVLIGLLTGMISRGARYVDFDGPTRFEWLALSQIIEGIVFALANYPKIANK